MAERVEAFHVKATAAYRAADALAPDPGEGKITCIIAESGKIYYFKPANVVAWDVRA